MYARLSVVEIAHNYERSTGMNVKEFILAKGLILSAVHVESDTADFIQWSVSIRRYAAEASFSYLGNKLPNLVGVMQALKDDALACENSATLEEFKERSGHTDSASAERAFNACRENRERLEALLGKVGYAELLWEVS
jgi:hypothetical protein